MDLGGVVGMDGLVGASFHCGGVFFSPRASSEPESNRQNGFLRSGLVKEGRTCGPEEHDWRYLKGARTEAPSLFPDGEQMLSFSSSKPDAFLFSSEPLSSAPLASSYVGNTGLVSGSLDVKMHGVLAGFKGPFTPSQWMELEQQALIYKYMNANAPIPTSLLISIRRSLSSSRFSSFSAGSLGTNTFRWGSFHLGFSGNADPEPGRCRRTDGKKWRCSRDAVADQKYCERHMNRGRHRSRKPVEGQAGHAAKVMPIVAPTPTAAAVSGSGSSNSFAVVQQQTDNVKPNITYSSSTHIDRILANNELNNSHDLTMLKSVNSEPTETLFPIADQHNPFAELPSRPNYGLNSDSPFKLPGNSYLGNDSLASSVEFNDQDSPTNTFRHFINDLHKNQSDSSTISWTEREMQSDKTQLSISVPVASSDFSSSSSSPTHEKHTPSSLKLSLDFDPDNTHIGVGGHPNDGNQRQASWPPTSWVSSMGGPLGEVLAYTCNNLVDHDKNFSSLKLMTNGWDSSPRLRSSPTGVLQKFSFGSLCSTTSSPRVSEMHNVQDSYRR